MAGAKTLAIEVDIRRKKLSASAAKAFGSLNTYDRILFTSKNAVLFFFQELQERRIVLPKKIKVSAIGPTTAKTLGDLGYPAAEISKTTTVAGLIQKLRKIEGKQLLFPRSAIAPREPVRLLQKLGAKVTVLPLYTAEAKQIAKNVRTDLLNHSYTRISFKSPSGVQGLIRQFTSKEFRVIKTITAACIGPTTARAARAAGFKKVLISTMI